MIGLIKGSCCRCRSSSDNFEMSKRVLSRASVRRFAISCFNGGAELEGGVVRRDAVMEGKALSTTCNDTAVNETCQPSRPSWHNNTPSAKLADLQSRQTLTELPEAKIRLGRIALMQIRE
jgi:hypothetical protein